MWLSLCDSTEMMGFCNDVYPSFVEDKKSAIPGSKNRDWEHLEGEQLKEPKVKKVVELWVRKAPKIKECQQPEAPQSSKTASKSNSLKKMQFTTTTSLRLWGYRAHSSRLNQSLRWSTAVACSTHCYHKHMDLKGSGSGLHTLCSCFFFFVFFLALGCSCVSTFKLLEMGISFGD